MPMINQDFEIYKDSNLVINFIFEDEQTLNLNSAVWGLGIRGKKILKKEIGSGLTVTGNRIILSITPSETVNLPSGDYEHELRITNNTGLTAPVAIGGVKVIPVLTRS